MFSRTKLTSLLLACALLAGCTGARAGDRPPAGSESQSGASVSAPPAAPPIPEPVPEPTPEEPAAPPYDFSQPAPETEPVELDYFDSAAFVGDSRTDGFLIYSGIGRGENLTSNGLSIFALDEKKALTINGEKYTLLQALGLKEYDRVYLSLGVNELGFYDDAGFYKAYCQAIDDIRVCQPNAVIYIQGLIPLNEKKVAETGGRDYLKNDHLRIYNDLMRQAAEEKQVAFLDLYAAFADEDGQLPYDASRDGVHLTKDFCRRWLTYLQSHTVDFDALYPNGQPAPETEDGSKAPEGGEKEGAEP